jgi:hypothetical protein
MTDGLILDRPSEDPDVFECPHCKETIDSPRKTSGKPVIRQDQIDDV